MARPPSPNEPHLPGLGLEDAAAVDQGPAHEPAPAPEGTYVRVAVDRGIDDARSDGSLTYRAEDETDAWQPGQWVRVPLGRAHADGVIVTVGGPELAAGLDARRIRAVRERLGVALPDDLIELGRWVARYYHCPLGLTLAAMLPSSVKKGVGTRTVRRLDWATPAPPSDTKLPPSATKALEALQQAPSGSLPNEARALADLVGAKTRAPINALVRAGYLQIVTHEVVRAPDVFARGTRPNHTPPEPTPDQQRVVDAITPTLGRFAMHVLRGVTGSGKTEVYLRVIRHLLDSHAHRDQSALMLVPEISLTPQTAGRFLDRFEHEGVAVLHSGLPASVRHQQWDLAASGKARVVVGARSAVFAPVPSLGLVIVDEEHDASYKQDRAPRYHGRDVAIKRAQLAGCPIVLASATPSLEAWTMTLPPRPGAEPRAQRHELTQRVAGGSLPEVTIVDLTRERPNGAQLAVVTPTLHTALVETLDDGGQAILLLNRRGVSSFLGCANRTCGWTLSCDSCDVTMVMHVDRSARNERRFLRCHHCGAERLVPKSCPSCGGGVIRLTPGTQSAADEIAARLREHGLDPDQVLRRVDSDNRRTAADHFAVLDAFERGEVRVLIGTQMLAKGLDFPNVRLVGVLSADTALAMPDFRASERGFQLLSQVAGRAGRSHTPGRVIIQTAAPENPVIRHAAAHDYLAFAREELEHRRIAGYPPFARLARVVCRHTEVDTAERRAEDVARTLEESSPPGVRVVGPAPCVIPRLADEFRVGVELFAPTAAAANETLARARARGVFGPDTVIDMDPTSLM